MIRDFPPCVKPYFPFPLYLGGLPGPTLFHPCRRLNTFSGSSAFSGRPKLIRKIAPPPCPVNLLDKHLDLRYIPHMTDDQNPTDEQVQAAARVLAKRGASKGGKARAKALGKWERQAIARMGGEASARKRKRGKDT